MGDRIRFRLESSTINLQDSQTDMSSNRNMNSMSGTWATRFGTVRAPLQNVAKKSSSTPRGYIGAWFDFSESAKPMDFEKDIPNAGDRPGVCALLQSGPRSPRCS